MSSDPQTCTLAEAAEAIGIHPKTAYRLDRQGEFPVPVLHIGRAKRVSLRQLEAFIHGDQAIG